MKKEFYKEYFYFEEKHWWFCGRWKIVSFFLRIYLKAKMLPKILDIGTGTGKMFELLSQYGGVTGIDNSRIAIKFCRERGVTNVINADAQSIPFKDFSFDFVCAMDIIEHLNNDIISVREFYRVLRRNGILLLTVPAFMFLWGSHDEINIHKKRYNIKEISNIIRRTGFKIEKLSYFNFLLFPVIFFIRVGKKLLKGKESKSDLKDYAYLINKVLEGIFSFERFLLKYWNLPFGGSILCIARKME